MGEWIGCARDELGWIGRAKDAPKWDGGAINRFPKWFWKQWPLHRRGDGSPHIQFVKCFLSFILGLKCFLPSLYIFTLWCFQLVRIPLLFCYSIQCRHWSLRQHFPFLIVIPDQWSVVTLQWFSKVNPYCNSRSPCNDSISSYESRTPLYSSRSGWMIQALKCFPIKVTIQFILFLQCFNDGLFYIIQIKILLGGQNALLNL